jgi:stage II sporulation protein R
MKKKRHRLLALLIIIAVASAVLVGYKSKDTYDYSRVQAGIAKQIIRFHIRANSDSDEDQQLKLRVKDKVVTYMEPLLKDSLSIDESRQILTDHIEDIRSICLDELNAAGSTEDVNVYFEKSYFPMKSYGDFTFPPGTYEAFRIDIGQFEGKNWWCVLYPPLCFVDATYGVLPEDSKQTLKNILTDNEYNAITETQYKFRFKYLTFLNGWMESIFG